MHFKTLVGAGALWAALPISASPVQPRSAEKFVFAHFMVGIVQNYQVDDWKQDMVLAQEIGIDAFALNNAKIDSYTPTQLANAYQAAEEVGFKVFPSFDFSYWNNGDTNLIASYMQNYSGHPAQMQYQGGALVSTFVGDSFNWGGVQQQVSNKLTPIPMLQDPAEWNGSHTALGLSGAFSWLAWPTDGGNSIIPGPMTTIWDDRFFQDLNGAPYMAPVSPWFATHFNSKNWVFICEQLITDRWNEMLELQPALIEIITWNDYGESHYIGPWEPNHTDDGSSEWAEGMPHDGWRLIMKPYIAAYKAGASEPSVDSDQLVYWYRPFPKATICTNDTLGAPNGISMLQDLVFVTTLLTSPATLTVTSGNMGAQSISVPAGVVTHNFTMGVGSQHFQVTRNGAAVMGGTGGLDISNTCEIYNFNAYVGSFNGSNTAPTSGTPTTTKTTKTTTTTTSTPHTTTTSTTTTSTTTTSTTTTSTTTTSTTTTAKPPTTTSTTTTSSGGSGCKTITASSQIFPTNCLHGCDIWAGPPGQSRPDHCDGS